MNSNYLYAIIGALAFATAVFGYQSYKAQQEPTGVQISIGENGLSITEKK